MESTPGASPDRRRGGRLALALGAGAVLAVAYGVLAEPFAVSWGLIAVGLIGGWLIGAALAGRGTRATELAMSIALAAWLIGIIGAFVLSQLFLPEANTPFTERLSLERFEGYLGGTIAATALPRLLALAGSLVTAWRSAR